MNSQNTITGAEALWRALQEEEARGAAAFTPPRRKREVSRSLRSYAAAVSSADEGAIRKI